MSVIVNETHRRHATVKTVFLSNIHTNMNKKISHYVVTYNVVILIQEKLNIIMIRGYFTLDTFMRRDCQFIISTYCYDYYYNFFIIIIIIIIIKTVEVYGSFIFIRYYL